MKRLLLPALLMSACIGFDQLEAEALDAGGFLAGGSASAGGAASAGGSVSAGGSASAGGTASAGGSAAGGTVSDGGADAGSLFGTPPLLWSGIALARTANTLIALAATPGNGNFIFAERTEANLIVRSVNSPSFSFDSGVAVHDLDARFSLSTITTSQGVWVLDELGTWSPLQSAITPNGSPTSTAIFQPSMSGPKLASFWRSNAVNAYAATRQLDGGFLLAGAATLLGLTGPVIARPTEGGDAGLALSASQLVRVDSYLSVSDPLPLPAQASDLRLASSESQLALLGCRQTASRSAAWFWRPGNPRAMVLPDVLIEGSAGVPTLHALATNGTEHAAILGPTPQAGSSFWVNGDVDAGVAVASDVWLLVTFTDSGRARFFTLGPSLQSPVALAFGTAGGDAGVFVMANCVTNSNVPSLCTQQGGGVIGFLPSP